MNERRSMRRLGVLCGALAICGSTFAQGRGPGRGEQPRTPKTAAPYDITGYWVSVVTEDWRFRMVMPPKGDHNGIALNAAGRKIADAWDPGKDEAAGEQCKSYGAPGLMRVPGRLHVTWQDDQTLRIDVDAGQQTRLLHFDSAESGAGTWQGYSRRGGGGGRFG